MRDEERLNLRLRIPHARADDLREPPTLSQQVVPPGQPGAPFVPGGVQQPNQPGGGYGGGGAVVGNFFGGQGDTG